MDRHELLSLVRFTFLLLCVLLTFSCRNTADDRRMAQIIHEADSLNRNDIAMTNDSLLLMACRYYDRHGTPNEQMRAHYLLGCVYRDRGEAPRAIDCYKDAIAKADTTASDCDYHVLGCVYGQMAAVYHKQLLFGNEICAYKQARHYSIRASDSLIYSIRDQIMIGGVYILLNKNDSAEYEIKDAIQKCEQNGYHQDAVLASTLLMHLYTKRTDKIIDLKSLIDRYDAECSYFDNHHELPSNLRQFYSYKGWYFESINKLDSAEYYYRKIYFPEMSFVVMDPMYRGLLSVFEKRHEADSIAKYARLFCMVNDSSIAVKDRELTAHISASYDYTSYQRLALSSEKKIRKTQGFLFLLVVVLLISAVLAIAIWLRQRRKLEMIQNEYTSASESYTKNLHRLRVIEKSHRDVIAQIQSELVTAQAETIEYKSMKESTEKLLSALNDQYEKETKELIEENNLLKEKIEELGRFIPASSAAPNMMKLKDVPIVKRVFELCDTPLNTLSEDEKNVFLNEMGHYNPSLFRDLQHSQISQLGQYVCMLVSLNIRTSDISNLLGLSPQQVANLKQDINKTLFHDSTARTLYKNLVEHYRLVIR